MPRPTQAIFAAVIKNPKDARVLAGLGFLHLALGLAGFSGWGCPILLATGVPCPGCGLTRGTAALLRGDWKAMAETHLFAPLFLGAAAITGITVLVPELWRKRILEFIEEVEEQTQISLLLIISLFIYWGLRLGLQTDQFITLMKSAY